MKTNKRGTAVFISALALSFSIIPPALAILFYFPVWIELGSEYVISGILVLLMLVAFLPLFRLVKQMLKSPSGYAVWLVIFIVFLLLSKIAEEMITISFVGLVGNIIGAALFKLARRFEKNEG